MDPVPPGGWGTAGGAPDVHPTTGAGQEGQGAPVGGLDAGNAPQSSVYAEQNRYVHENLLKTQNHRCDQPFFHRFP